MPGRTFVGADGYRYGFNGQEKDDEAKGTGNSYDFGARIYDPRLGKFFSTDPLIKSFAFNSSYLFAGNSPIQAIDYNGEKIYCVTANGSLIDATSTLIKTPTGRALIKKYNESVERDIYIAVSTNFTSTTRDAVGVGGKAGGLTQEDAKPYVKGGKINGLSKAFEDAATSELAKDNADLSEVASYEEASNAFKVFEGVDVSKSKGRKISLIVLDADLLDKSDKSDNAESIFHEIFAHIFLADQGIEDTGVQHKIYGNKYSSTPADPGTPGENIQKELNKVKKNDVAKKSSETKKK